MSNLKVAVRVRPMLDREIHNRAVPSVSIDNGTISVTNIKVPRHHAGDSRERIRKFTFDYCFDENSSQDEVFSMVEGEVSSALSSRYHACVLAYGQSSTGKTYTMMGLQDEPGLTPRLCENIFRYFQSSVTEEEAKRLHTYVSYLEIYNERVQDLLTSGTNCKSLKVREHPKRGPYVQGLSEHVVTDPAQLLGWLTTGNGNRRVAATANNRRSSRSHSVFSVTCTYGAQSCRLHLVDLAGSERAHSSSTTPHHAPRLKEGANINRSLVALGNVICALSEHSGRSGRNNRKRFVPYRDSILTWLLKETLGGNSKTVMIATISPSSSCYNETVNTLRFGQRAKQIVNRPVVNEDAKEKLIRELRAEIIRLKELLALQNGMDVFQSTSNSITNTSSVDMTDSPPSSKDEAQILKEESFSSESESEDIDSSVTSTNLDNSLKNSSVPEEDSPIPDTQDTVNSSKCSTPIHVQTDTLIPVIDIVSSVKPKVLRPTKLNRTYSVEFPKAVIGKLKKEFGSHETLPNDFSRRATRSITNRSGRLSTRASTENLAPRLVEVGSKYGKSNESLTRSGSVSELSGVVSPQLQTASAKKVVKRSEVVAAVTERLYSHQFKKKQADKTAILEYPRQNICSNARMRLQELTHRALRASKRKVHIDTQTEDTRTLRVKEKSTDVQDIEVALLKVKDAVVEANTETQNIGVSCLVENYNESLKLTRTCASQTDEPKNQSVSFTKYLQNPPLTIHSYSQPIYTSSVNINVSHNYPFGKEEISDDSLEDCSIQNIHYSTPDLISNHNSLEPSINTKLPATQISGTGKEFYCHGEKQTSHAFIDSFPNKLEEVHYFATDYPNPCVAGISTTPCVTEVAKKIPLPIVHASEIRCANEFTETCTVLRKSDVPLVKPVQTFETFQPVKAKTFVINSPKKLKSIIKPKNKLPLHLSTDESDSESSVSFNKKVRFSPIPKRKDMVDVLSRFMDEASTLMSKLDDAVRQVEKSDVIRSKRSFFSKPNPTGSFYTFDTKDCYVQTYFPHHNASCQTSPLPELSEDFGNMYDKFETEIPENKWERILQDSCDKLEQCVKLAEYKSQEAERRKLYSGMFDSETLHRFPQPFSIDSDWKYCPTEYSSLETTNSASDYGSLPRREGLTRRSSYRYYSPKAYMKHLVALRKQIVESSRKDLMAELRSPLDEV